MTRELVPQAYTEHAPPPPLGEYVECVWTRGMPASPNEQTHVLPDGCIDVVLSYRTAEAGEPPSAALAVGTMTRPLVVAARDACAYVGVRFWPGRALPFIGVPAAELTDLRVDVADLWTDRGSSLEHVNGVDVTGVRATFERLLLYRLNTARPLDRTVDAAVRAITETR